MSVAPEQAFGAHMSVQKERDDAKLSTLRADEVDTSFEAAQKKALGAVGGFIPRNKKNFTCKALLEQDLPSGVRQRHPGRFSAEIQWGGKTRQIGTFDSPEQAFAAFSSVKKERGSAKLSELGADEVNALFSAAQEKAVESAGVLV